MTDFSGNSPLSSPSFLLEKERKQGAMNSCSVLYWGPFSSSEEGKTGRCRMFIVTKRMIARGGQQLALGDCDGAGLRPPFAGREDSPESPRALLPSDRKREREAERRARARTTLESLLPPFPDWSFLITTSYCLLRCLKEESLRIAEASGEINCSSETEVEVVPAREEERGKRRREGTSQHWGSEEEMGISDAVTGWRNCH